jgi:hypothetical protein
LRAAAKRFAVWALCAAAATGAVEAWYRSVPTTDFDRRLLDFTSQRGEIEVLILGSSQMRRGAVPDQVDRGAFNMASMSQDLYYDAQIILRNLDAMPRLRAVLWELQPFRIGYDLSRTPGERRLAKLYDPYFARRFGEPAWRELLHARLSFLRVRGNDPIADFLALLERSMHPTLRASMPKADGFSPRPARREDLSGAAERGRRHAGMFDARLVEANLELVQGTVRLLEQRGIRVVFVDPPVAPAYRAALPPELIEAQRRFAQRLAAGSQAELLDLSGALPVGRGYFFDADHLQGEGAARFSRLLGQALASAAHR